MAKAPSWAGQVEEFVPFLYTMALGSSHPNFSTVIFKICKSIVIINARYACCSRLVMLPWCFPSYLRVVSRFCSINEPVAHCEHGRENHDCGEVRPSRPTWVGRTVRSVKERKGGAFRVQFFLAAHATCSLRRRVPIYDCAYLHLENVLCTVAASLSSPTHLADSQ